MSSVLEPRVEVKKTPATAPGAPGIEPHWTSAGKTGIGTAISADSNVWFTLSHGIVNEVYFPYLDQANIRDMQLIITDGHGYFCEEKRDMIHQIEFLEMGVPAYRLTNTCKSGKCQVIKIVHCDPNRNVLLQSIQFKPLIGKLSDYRVFALMAPHVRNCGYGNDAWVGDFKGYPMLFARRHGTSVCLGCSIPYLRMTCGYVGVSDGWLDLYENKQLTKFYDEAFNGNVALTGEIDIQGCQGHFKLALGFGRGRAESGQQTRASLLVSYDILQRKYIQGWEEVQGKFLNLGKEDKALAHLYRISTMVLQTHMAKHYSGAMIASLSIPWGFSKGDNDIGGYHLVWPRDQVLNALGFLAAGHTENARIVLSFLLCNQECDGHWVQNMWDDGTPYWDAVQMDETAMPIILARALHRADELKTFHVWPMVMKAAGYIVRNGPKTEQDRWEEDGGYTPFTYATEIAALLAAAEFADEAGESQMAQFLRETADRWHEMIDLLTYAVNTPLAKKYGVEGYYVRVSDPKDIDMKAPTDSAITIKNRPESENHALAWQIVSTDALALVRFGLRAADDPRILNTVKVIDEMLKVETSTGTIWHRYNEDGYGEHHDGRPFDGTGHGRAWPLLTGERGMYEVARGNFKEAKRLLNVMVAQTGAGGMLPEQIWESADIPARGLYNGRPSGSAMPLVWAHSEFIKLLRSVEEGKVIDMPPETIQRYQKDKVVSNHWAWKFEYKTRVIPRGKILRVLTLGPATVRWTLDRWDTVHDTKLSDSKLGIYFADIPTENLRIGEQVTFTFFWTEVDKWEGEDFTVTVKE